MRYHIPTPCNENWDKMTPTEQGRFCSLCSKTVVDFTRMSDDEVLNYFANNKNENVCGRIKKQPLLPEITIRIPASTIHRRYNNFQTFLLALLLSFGVLLTGFTGEKTHAEFAIENTNSIAAVDSPPPAPNFSDYLIGEVSLDNDILITDPMPQYPGGDSALKAYLSDKLVNLDYDKYNDSFPRKVFVKAIINKEGSITEPKIFKNGLDSSFNVLIIKVLNEMPKWEPGSINGRKVDVSILLPIKILPKE